MFWGSVTWEVAINAQFREMYNDASPQKYNFFLMYIMYSSALQKTQCIYSEAHTFSSNLFLPPFPLQLTVSNLFVILWLLCYWRQTCCVLCPWQSSRQYYPTQSHSRRAGICTVQGIPLNATLASELAFSFMLLVKLAEGNVVICLCNKLMLINSRWLWHFQHSTCAFPVKSQWTKPCFVTMSRQGWAVICCLLGLSFTV